LPPNRAKLGAG